ncbi:hypothetical protein E4U43_005783 [Claviceps pusilla]|uniref:Thymidylate kinase n=1 Tax=Claviceps pusilla TaxID=123648 RepID=A0A9P7N447_9HYPO|nr:hypothetical protein E4U43_005783 [Claviceps pusilla]
MASISRQPFAPLGGSRLQSLTSWKNRQNNALTAPSNNIKRKAERLDADEDFENVDPCLSAKRSKGALGTPIKDLAMNKPSAYVLTRAAAATPTTPTTSIHSIKASTAPRRTLQPRSPISKMTTGASKSSPLSAPAGRSPARGARGARGTRSGLLSNHRQSTAGFYTRVDPPSFNLDGAAASFSLDAALKGTISSYGPRPRSNAVSKASSSISSALGELDTMESWFFDIHEDTPEQEMTNLLQHSTCVLDLSSDEESEQKARREKAEGRDKENVPPSGHVSQTSARPSARAAACDDMVVDKERVVLGEMKTTDLVAADGNTSLVMMNAGGDDDDDNDDDNDNEGEAATAELASGTAPLVGKYQLPLEARDVGSFSVTDAVEAKSAPGAEPAILQPIEGTGESFDLVGRQRTDDEASE